MMTIADAAASLTADPRPVLLLDTGVLLAGARAQSDRINECKILSDTIVTAPGRVQPIVTSLVLREWLQNKEEVRQEAFRMAR